VNDTEPPEPITVRVSLVIGLSVGRRCEPETWETDATRIVLTDSSCACRSNRDQRGDPALEPRSQSQGGSRHYQVIVMKRYGDIPPLVPGDIE